MSPFYICNNSLKTESISINYGIQYSEKSSHQKIINLPTYSVNHVAALPCKTQM